ncbi:MAG: hypothetical protein IPH06_13685 [Alphaproteobacteria bacterium]|nr:hypothetical protein [Alphaproteobacteria bacterium]
MSEFEENFSSWQPPKGTGDAAFRWSQSDRLWVVVKLAGSWARKPSTGCCTRPIIRWSTPSAPMCFLVDALGGSRRGHGFRT